MPVTVLIFAYDSEHYLTMDTIVVTFL